MMTIAELKKGDFFTKKEISNPTPCQVWVRMTFAYRKNGVSYYLCHRWSDIFDECVIRGDKEVYTEFTF